MRSCRVTGIVELPMGIGDAEQPEDFLGGDEKPFVDGLELQPMIEQAEVTWGGQLLCFHEYILCMRLYAQFVVYGLHEIVERFGFCGPEIKDHVEVSCVDDGHDLVRYTAERQCSTDIFDADHDTEQ